ncbi:MAG TPA: hypothetical protein VLW52_02240 [Opitutaceae bacterium]|nr:hypothetical protein [Opitutaceae bacterium]
MMKNWKKVIRQVLFFSVCFATSPVTCHSIFERSKTASDDTYEYVTPTGSLMPQRVKKGEGAVTASPTGAMSGDEFDKMRQKLQTPGKSATGGQ